MGTSKSYITPTNKDYTLTKRAITSSVKNYSNTGSNKDISNAISRLSNNMYYEKVNNSKFYQSLNSILTLVAAFKHDNVKEWIADNEQRYGSEIISLVNAYVSHSTNDVEKAKSQGYLYVNYDNPRDLYITLIKENIEIDSISQAILLTSITDTIKDLKINSWSEIINIDLNTFVKVFIINIVFQTYLNRYYEQIVKKFINLNSDFIKNYIETVKSFITNAVNVQKIDDNIVAISDLSRIIDLNLDNAFNMLKELGELK